MTNTTTPSAPASSTPEETLLAAAGATQRRFLQRHEITADDDFQLRQWGIQREHVRGLAQTLRNTGQLEPVLVWEEIDAAGKPTGRLILLDGQHRIAAHDTVHRGRKGILAAVFRGDRNEAVVEAAMANSRESLPLTKNERMNAAWKIVRLTGKRPTVPVTANATGVAPRTVDMMRKRWAAMQAEGKQATGSWWKDRQDEPPQIKDEPEMTDKERQQRITALAEEIRKALGKQPWQDEQIAAEALLYAVGSLKLKSMAGYLFADEEPDEFAEYFTGEVSTVGITALPSTTPEADSKADF